MSKITELEKRIAELEQKVAELAKPKRGRPPKKEGADAE